MLTINSIQELHDNLQIAPPKHPLISVIQAKDLPNLEELESDKCVLNLYMISLKDGASCAVNYVRNSYDFSTGTMIFSKPNQVLSYAIKEEHSEEKGWLLFFHPDLIRKSILAQNIETYSFFDYEVHEALHLSLNEQENITNSIHKIIQEYEQNMDQHSQKLIISNLELLLDYCNRYYDRQFYIRTNLNQDLISEFEQLLKVYFSSEKPIKLGIPSVKYCGNELHMSPNYLSDLLKRETGKSAIEHIHDFIINRAKNKLLSSKNSISEIAFDLGFDYPQHFSKLFKRKTGVTPRKYRTKKV